MNEREIYQRTGQLPQSVNSGGQDALEFYNEFIADGGLDRRVLLKSARHASIKPEDFGGLLNQVQRPVEEGWTPSQSIPWRVFWWVLVAIITHR